MLRIDDSRAPIYCYWFAEPGAAVDYDKLMLAIDDVIARDEPYAIMVNGEEGVVPEARMLRRLAGWLKRHREAMRRNALGVAVITMNPVKRGVVRTVLWMEPSPIPCEVFRDEASALEWLERKVARAVSEPPAASGLKSVP